MYIHYSVSVVLFKIAILLTVLHGNGSTIVVKTL